MVSVLVLKGSGEDTKVLALHRSAGRLGGVWSYCAGHLEPGEPGWRAARRELLEETGLEPLTLHATSFCEQFYAPQDDCVEIVPAFVARVQDDAVVRLNGEHVEHRWVSFEEASSMFPFGSQRDLLAHVEREFVTREPSPFLLIGDR